MSIVIPVFNGAEALQRSVSSVLAQTMENLEVIVVDDASTEKIELVYKDSRVRMLRHAQNRGPAAARNTGFAECRGEYVGVLDADDEWFPTKLEKQLDAIQDHQVALCGLEEVSDLGRKVVLPPSNEDWRRRFHWQSGIAAGSIPLVRRTFLEGRGQDERMRLLEDWEWLLRLCQDSQPAYVREVLVTKHERKRRIPFELAERCTKIFLEKHDDDFGREGWTHRRWVRAKHFERLAEVSFRARQFTRGTAWLLRSFATNPFQSPIRLGAVVAAPVDALTGSSLIETAASWKNRLIGERGKPGSGE